MDTADRWRRTEELFHAALDIEPTDRAAFLQQACGADAELLQEVQSLLQSAEESIDFLPQAVFEVARSMKAESGPNDPTTGFGPIQNRITIALGTLLAHYKVVSLLGGGGMGEVYLAEDTRLRRKVALKLLLPDLITDQRGLFRFEQEALAASALNHPNILTIYEFGQADGLNFIACEFVDGNTLRQKIGKRGLELNEAIDVAIQIASALAAAHASGIVHRDIKPENVIVRCDGIVKVLDFGIAKLEVGRLGTVARRSTGAVVAVQTTEPGVVHGTPRYMSPEQARGLHVDARSDLFSLGSVLYEMITGAVAFDGSTTSDVIAGILKDEPAPPTKFAPDTPPEVERIIAKSLCKDRDSRYQSAQELLTDLQNYRRERAFQTQLQGSTPPSQPRAGLAPTPSGALHVPMGEASRGASWLWRTLLLLVLVAVAGYFGLKKYQQEHSSKGPRSLAILPFRNLNGDPQTDFLGFSLADEIITKLDYVNSLVVRPSYSVDKYRDRVVDPKTVAEDLKVDTLLTGTFIRDGDDLRITTQLIDVKADKIIWREAFGLKYDKLLTVQDRVAQQIINQLELNLSPAEAANLKPAKPISTTAYEDYLRGIDLYSLNEFSEAIQMLEKATSLEPNYAPAWAQLGRAYTTSASLLFGGQEQYGKAQAAYEKAIALNPSLAEARIYMANLLTDTGRVEQAVPMLRAVLQENPNNAEAHWELGYAYRFAGMLQESVQECERARANNPDVKISSSAMNSYLYLGEYEKFLQSLPANDSVYILFYRGLAEYYMNNREQAARDFDRAFEKNGSLLPAAVGRAFSYSIHHENANGIKLLGETEAKIEERGVSDPEGMYKVAQAYAVLGDKASALHMLRHSIGGGFFCYPYLAHDPLLQSLHGEPEFQMLMDQARHRHEQFKASFF
jgi:serine/threonine protein kinase/tetratricopeptide (TPR) repeat protein